MKQRDRVAAGKAHWQDKWDEFRERKSKLYSLEEPGEFSSKLQKYLHTLLDTEKPRYDTVMYLRFLKDYFEPVGGISEELEDRLITGGCYRCGDPILENLQTHDYQQLGKALQSEFGGSWKKLSSGDSSKERIQWVAPLAALIQDDFKDRVKDVADFYGYSVSDHGGSVIEFEPVYPESAGSYIRGECKGQVYHFCIRGERNEEGKVINDSVADSIEWNGLRCKNGPTEKDDQGNLIKPYRTFPKRIYVLAFEVPGTNIEQEIKDRLWMKSLTWDEAAVFKINVRHLPYTFYRDTALDDDHAFFTYNNIPPSLITRVH